MSIEIIPLLDAPSAVFVLGIEIPMSALHRGIFNRWGVSLLEGAFLSRVLETKTNKYSAQLFPTVNKEHIQSLGVKNRLFLIEALGTGSASNSANRTALRTSALLIPGQDGYIVTGIIPSLSLKFLKVEIDDKAERPAELKIVIYAVEGKLGGFLTWDVPIAAFVLGLELSAIFDAPTVAFVLGVSGGSPTFDVPTVVWALV